MNKLDAKGKGILLLHDIHPATAALPNLLKALKSEGYGVIHVMPQRDMPKSVGEIPFRLLLETN